MNKIIVLLVLIILLINPISAKTIEKELYENSNVEVPGYNITLLLIGANEKSIVVCINNEKKIIDRNSQLVLENLRIEPLHIYPENIKLKITYSCEECVCNESCSNNLCFPQSKEQQSNESQETQQTVIQQQETIKEKDNITTISIILIVIVLILLIALLIKKRKR